MKMLTRQNEQGSATLAIISVDNLCLLHQYKWPEHNQNTIAAIKGAVSRNSANLGNYKMPIKLRET